MSIDKINFQKRYKLQLPSLMTISINLFIGLIIGYLGPFGSYEMPLQYRLSYWVILIGVGHLIYSQINDLCHWYFDSKIKSRVIQFLLPSIFGAALLSFFVEYMSHLFYNLELSIFKNFLFFFPKVFILGLVLNFIGLLLDRYQETHKQIATNQQDQDPLLNNFFNRLPKKLGKELICFSMEDHYLHVHTEIGSHMMLMRMKDALVELKNYNGLQVHRSWWIATDAVIDVKKEARKATLIMKNNMEVPVSQKYLPIIKEANLF